MAPWQDVAVFLAVLAAAVVLFRAPIWLAERFFETDLVERVQRRLLDESPGPAVRDGWRCPHCGTTNEEGYTYCRECLSRFDR